MYHTTKKGSTPVTAACLCVLFHAACSPLLIFPEMKTKTQEEVEEGREKQEEKEMKQTNKQTDINRCRWSAASSNRNPLYSDYFTTRTVGSGRVRWVGGCLGGERERSVRPPHTNNGNQDSAGIMTLSSTGTQRQGEEAMGHADACMYVQSADLRTNLVRMVNTVVDDKRVCFLSACPVVVCLPNTRLSIQVPLSCFFFIIRGCTQSSARWRGCGSPRINYLTPVPRRGRHCSCEDHTTGIT